ncbi:unnamed protein product [Urochloa humidicola]
MAVAISAVAPPSLHGRSRLSRSSAPAGSPRRAPPLFTGDDDARTAPPFLPGGFLALMLGQCELLSFPDDDLPPPPPLPLSQEGRCLRPSQMFCRQQLSLDAALQAPVSEDDVDVLAPMFSQEEIQALRAAHHAPPPPPLRFAVSRPRSRSDGRAGVKRKPCPAAYPPWPSCISDDDDEREDSPPPPPVKRVRKKIVIRRRDAAARAARLRRKLREWHGTIASRILRRQFRPPEPSRGRTALGCQCHELSLAAAGGGGCALHQETREPGDRAWMYTAQGRLPLVGGPGEVLVPTMAAGNSKASVLQYARWRRGVRMPSRFYLENAAQQQRQVTLAAFGRRPEDDDRMMMID